MFMDIPIIKHHLSVADYILFKWSYLIFQWIYAQNIQIQREKDRLYNANFFIQTFLEQVSVTRQLLSVISVSWW